MNQQEAFSTVIQSNDI